MITQVHQAMPERAIRQLCEVLEVSRSWYYEKQSRPETSEPRWNCVIRLSGSSWTFLGMAIDVSLMRSSG